MEESDASESTRWAVDSWPLGRPRLRLTRVLEGFLRNGPNALRAFGMAFGGMIGDAVGGDIAGAWGGEDPLVFSRTTAAGVVEARSLIEVGDIEPLHVADRLADLGAAEGYAPLGRNDADVLARSGLLAARWSSDPGLHSTAEVARLFALAALVEPETAEARAMLAIVASRTLHRIEFGVTNPFATSRGEIIDLVLGELHESVHPVARLVFVGQRPEGYESAHPWCVLADAIAAVRGADSFESVMASLRDSPSVHRHAFSVAGIIAGGMFRVENIPSGWRNRLRGSIHGERFDQTTLHRVVYDLIALEQPGKFLDGLPAQIEMSRRRKLASADGNRRIPPIAD